MATDRERIATLEQIMREREGMVSEYKKERLATMQRLDDLEDTTSVLMQDKATRDTTTKERQRRIELRIQVLTVVVAIAAVIEPIMYRYTGG